MLENIDLKYGEKFVLRDVNLKISRNSRLGILGKAGSGKHSIMNVIFGIFKRSGGNIKIYGTDMDQIEPYNVREEGFYIGGDSSLFGVTIREDIDPEGKFATKNLIKVLAFPRFFKLIKQNVDNLNK